MAIGTGDKATTNWRWRVAPSWRDKQLWCNALNPLSRTRLGPNSWHWQRLSNMIYCTQPQNTGESPSTSDSLNFSSCHFHFVVASEIISSRRIISELQTELGLTRADHNRQNHWRLQCTTIRILAHHVVTFWREQNWNSSRSFLFGSFMSSTNLQSSYGVGLIKGMRVCTPD